MSYILQPFHLLVITLAGWLNRRQQVVIEYLISSLCFPTPENRGSGNQHGIHTGRLAR
jgi:hypothetical protein